MSQGSMTLSRKIILRNVALLGGLLLIAGASLWGLFGLRSRVNDALLAYQELKTMQTVSPQVATARSYLGTAEFAKAAPPLHSVIRQMEEFGVALTASAAAGERYSVRAKGMGEESVGKLRGVVGMIDRGEAPPPTALDSVVDDVNHLNRMCLEFVKTTQEAASDRVRFSILMIGAVCVVVIVGAVGVSIVQHRAIVRPLEALRAGVRQLTAHQFAPRVAVKGDAEFVSLAEEFNRMAEELDGFYRQLEEKVASKSKELVRSERLASLGFLAAGVAHEINNPLNVISGYAELLLKRVSKKELSEADGATGAALASDSEEIMVDLRESLGIIRDEAFRGKDITGKLLALARSSEARERVSLAKITHDVAALMTGLKNYRDRKLQLRFEQDDELCVCGNITELKQLLLNVAVNALEATRAGEGEVWITGRRHHGWVELCVRDNGRGMTPEVLDRIFEPFFTEKRGAGETGTGLGLSITHAIVESHGGRIRAESDGPGTGSRIIVQLPAVEEDTAAARCQEAIS